MYCAAPPQGITPPAPGLEHEEPFFVSEDDIPTSEDPHEADVLGQNEGDTPN